MVIIIKKNDDQFAELVKNIEALRLIISYKFSFLVDLVVFSVVSLVIIIMVFSNYSPLSLTIGIILIVVEACIYYTSISGKADNFDRMMGSRGHKMYKIGNKTILIEVDKNGRNKGNK